jgi:hypothetical protein
VEAHSHEKAEFPQHLWEDSREAGEASGQSGQQLLITCLKIGGLGSETFCVSPFT